MTSFNIKAPSPNIVTLGIRDLAFEFGEKKV